MRSLSQPENDGLITPVVGHQSTDKHYFLERYIDIFTTSMKGKWSLHFIDLFAGAGIERVKDSGTLRWGSPMLAAHATKPFDKLHLCELDTEKYEALKSRIGRYRPDSQILNGDANQLAKQIAAEIPPRSLSLAFLDPYGLQLDFSTIELLAGLRADLIIFFPDRLDILRNWKQYYYDNPSSNLDRYLGLGSNWRAILDGTPPREEQCQTYTFHKRIGEGRTSQGRLGGVRRFLLACDNPSLQGTTIAVALLCGLGCSRHLGERDGVRGTTDRGINTIKSFQG